MFYSPDCNLRSKYRKKPNVAHLPRRCPSISAKNIMMSEGGIFCNGIVQTSLARGSISRGSPATGMAALALLWVRFEANDTWLDSRRCGARESSTRGSLARSLRGSSSGRVRRAASLTMGLGGLNCGVGVSRVVRLFCVSVVSVWLGVGGGRARMRACVRALDKLLKVPYVGFLIHRGVL